MVHSTRYSKLFLSKFVATKLLGIRFDTLRPSAVLEQLRSWLNTNEQHTVFTPNPEMLVKARTDAYFTTILNSASLSLCDGKGTALFAQEKVYRFPGVDVMQALCGIAAEHGAPIFLLGSGVDAVVEATAAQLQQRFAKLRIVGIDKGPMVEEKSDGSLLVRNNEALLQQINEAKPIILFVAFGMGKQEKWIYENLAKLPSVKIAMGVGGSFDYISGLVGRAPLLLRQFGLEWAYRLVKQPQRLQRIWNATGVFTYLVLLEKLQRNKNV